MRTSRQRGLRRDYGLTRGAGWVACGATGPLATNARVVLSPFLQLGHRQEPLARDTGAFSYWPLLGGSVTPARMAARAAMIS
jgi:hypothetical protein